MDVTVTASDADERDLMSLRDSLVLEPELRGRARLASPSPQPGTMGALAETLLVTLAPEGAGAAFAAVLIAWLRERKSSVFCRIRRPDGSSIELQADRVRGLDLPAVRTQVTELARFLSENSGTGPGEALEQ